MLLDCEFFYLFFFIFKIRVNKYIYCNNQEIYLCSSRIKLLYTLNHSFVFICVQGKRKSYYRPNIGPGFSE
jgi:hypothetical protein